MYEVPDSLLAGLLTASIAVRPPGGQWFADDFDRPDSADLGPNWTVLVGNIAIVSHRASGANAAVSLGIVPSVSEVDGAVSCDFDLNSPVSTAQCGIGLRMDALQNGYVGCVRTSGTAVLYSIFRCVLGTEQTVASYTPVGVGSAGTMRFEAEGNQLRLYINDVLVLAAIDATYTAAGHCGIATRTNGPWMDNYVFAPL